MGTMPSLTHSYPDNVLQADGFVSFGCFLDYRVVRAGGLLPGIYIPMQCKIHSRVSIGGMQGEGRTPNNLIPFSGTLPSLTCSYLDNEVHADG